MICLTFVKRFAGRIWYLLVSVPIFFKILGTGFVVAAVFGGIVLYQARSSMRHTLYDNLEMRALTHRQRSFNLD